MPYAKISPKILDTACIIKEEPNSAQRRVPPYRNRTWSLSHLLAAAWGNEQMYRHQKCAHFLQSHPARNIPNRTDCVSRFESKSFLENILESYAGGEGYPQENVPVSGSMCAHFPWPIRHTDIPNRTDSVSRFESKSFLENILESNAGGGGAPPGATHCDDRRPEAEVTAAVCNAAWPNQAKQSCTFFVRSQPVSPLAGVNPRGIPPGMVE
jgi:hypothetical protein